MMAFPTRIAAFWLAFGVGISTPASASVLVLTTNATIVSGTDRGVFGNIGNLAELSATIRQSFDNVPGAESNGATYDRLYGSVNGANLPVFGPISLQITVGGHMFNESLSSGLSGHLTFFTDGGASQIDGGMTFYLNMSPTPQYVSVDTLLFAYGTDVFGGDPRFRPFSLNPMPFGNGHAGFDGYANFVTQGPLGTSDFQATPGITTLEIFDAPEPGWLWLVGLAGIWAARGANGRYRRRQVITDDTA